MKQPDRFWANQIRHRFKLSVEDWMAMNDNHALCPEAWCPAWKLCKGAHYAAGWPKPSRLAT